jgi:general secretion pathway protein L
MIAAADLSGAAPGQGGFLHWWREELAAAMPRRQLQARPPRNVLFLRRNGDDIELFRRRGKAASRLGTLTLPAPLPARAGEPIGRALPPESRRLITLLRRRRVPAVLLLEPDEGLLCDDRLPAGAAADIDRIMPHRVDLLTPWPADRVHAGYRLAGKRKDGQVNVLLGVAPRSGVDSTLARLAAWGVTVDRVDLLREDGDPAELNLLAPRRKQPSRRWRVLGLVAFILLACGGALAGFEIYRLHERLQSRTAFADALQQRLADMPGLVSRIDTMRKNAGFVPEQQRRTPSPIVVLEALSRILPDSIWLESVALEDDELTVSGYAEDAAQVLPIVESSAHFSAAQFRAPSTRVRVPGAGGGEREVERFTLSARVLPLSEPEP